MDKVTLALVGTIFLALAGVAGDFFINLAGEGKKFIDLKWFFVMKQIKLSTLGVFYAVSTVLFLTMVSIFYFKEGVNAKEIFGIGLAITSFVLLGKFA